MTFLTLRSTYLAAASAGVIAFVATAGTDEAFTDRDWSLSGFEWPFDFLSTVAVLAALGLAFGHAHARSLVGGRMHRLAVAARLSSDPRALTRLRWARRGRDFTTTWRAQRIQGVESHDDNPLRTYFDAHREGLGVWKWEHYLDIYHRHFARFRGTEVHVLEVGVYSGGSLEMWLEYFGPKCRVYGVDIDDSCVRFEDERTQIFIGDQADRSFWEQFRTEVPTVDIVIDDGGHEPTQQAVTLEELLPHLRGGGVYLCEDVHGAENAFGAYVGALTQAMDDDSALRGYASPDRSIVSATTPFQSEVDAIHCYPYVVVIEKRQAPLFELVAARRGTEWHRDD